MARPSVTNAPPCGHPGCALHGYAGMHGYSQISSTGYVSPPPGYSSPSTGYCPPSVTCPSSNRFCPPVLSSFNPIPSIYSSTQNATSPVPPPHPPNSPTGEPILGGGYDNLVGGGYSILPGVGHTNPALVSGYVNPVASPFCGFACSTNTGHESSLVRDACLMYPPITSPSWRTSYSHIYNNPVQGSSSEEADHQVMVSFNVMNLLYLTIKSYYIFKYKFL